MNERLLIYQLLLNSTNPLTAREIASIINKSNPMTFISSKKVSAIIRSTEGTTKCFDIIGYKSPYKYRALP